MAALTDGATAVEQHERRPTRKRAALAALAGVAALAGLVGAVAVSVDGRDGAAASASEARVAALLPDGVEWKKQDQLHPPFWKKGFTERGDEDPLIRGKLVGEDYYFYLEAPEGKRLQRTVVYLNTDLDRATGFSFEEFFTPNGTEAYLLLDFDSAGAIAGAGEVWEGCPPTGPAECRQKLGTFGEGDFVESELVPVEGVSNAVEVKIGKAVVSQLGPGLAEDLGVSFSFGYKQFSDPEVTEVALPEFFLNWYTVFDAVDAMPACTRNFRPAVVFSKDVQDAFFENRAYAQLYMSMQSQLMQAGMPYDRISFNDLLDIETVCQYEVLVIPYLAFLRPEHANALYKSLYFAIHYYGVGVVTSGDFAANDLLEDPLPGDPYFAMETLFGISDNDPVFLGIIYSEFYVSGDPSPMIDDLRGELKYTLLTNHSNSTNIYVPGADTAYDVLKLVNQRLTFPPEDNKPQEVHAALLSSRIDAATSAFGRPSGRVVHFSGLELLANTNLLWRAVRWIASERAGPGPGFGLRMSRKESIFTMRNDMDQSQFADQAKILEPALRSLFIEPMYEQYSLVGAYYINIGNDPANGASTDWQFFKEEYWKYIRMENEMGSHSYTHPHDINNATVDLEFEFDRAQEVIMAELDLARLGSAQPGAPDLLPTSYKVEPFFKTQYFSGGYSGVRAGYPNAFGYLDDTSPMVYVAPNMFFDFTMIEFEKRDQFESLDIWLAQWREHHELANMPVIHWPVHDYGPTDWNEASKTLFGKDKYSMHMFTEVVRVAFNDGTEFITPMDLNDRIRTFTDASLSVVAASETEATITVETVDAGISPTRNKTLGAFALQLQEGPAGASIVSVENWYAYSPKRVFLPRAGGTFTVSLGQVAEDVTRISDMGMRIELESLIGDGRDLDFVVHGTGTVTVTVVSAWADQEALVEVTGASAALAGNQLTLTLDGYGRHEIRVAQRITAAPTGAPISTPAPSKAPIPEGTPTQTPTKLPSVAPTTTPTKGPTRAPSRAPTFGKIDTKGPTVSPSVVSDGPEPGTGGPGDGEDADPSIVGPAIGGGVAAAVLLLSAAYFVGKRANEGSSSVAGRGSPDVVVTML